MFKSILCIFALTMVLNANNSDLVQEEDQIPQSVYQENSCDDKYDTCASKCENDDVTDIGNCYAQCEIVYQECVQQ